MGHRGHNNNNYRRMVMIELVTYRRFYCVAIAMNNVFTMMWLWSVKYNASVYPQRYTGLTVWIFFYIIITHQRRLFFLDTRVPLCSKRLRTTAAPTSFCRRSWPTLVGAYINKFPAVLTQRNVTKYAPLMSQAPVAHIPQELTFCLYLGC